MNIAFVGLGRMGSGMARSLLRAGHSVTVFNRTRSAADILEAEGARVAETPREASLAGVVCTMVADDSALEQITFDDHGILNALPPGGTHVSHSTIGTALARRLAQAHAERGHAFVSAPVFGRPEAAEAAQVIVVAAGATTAVDSLAPVFQAIGRKTVIAGTEPWKANAVKLCGNFMLASMLETFGEAVAAMRKSGVDPATFLEIMSGLFRSPVYDAYGKAIVQQQFEPAGFALKLGLKDVRLALKTADELEVPMPLASLLHDQFLTALASGQGEWDWSSVARVSARNAGLG